MIVTRTPVRISIGGGGTDLPFYYTKHKCFLVTAAIDKYIYITVNKRFLSGSLIKYSETEFIHDNFKIKHPLIRESLRLLNIKESIEISSLADIDSKSGLGSSGAFTVGLLHALHIYKGELVSKKTLAEEACHIAMKILKEPSGKQDEYAAAFGGIINLKINKQGVASVTPLDLKIDTTKELENNLMFFYTGYRRSAKEILESQKTEAEKDEKKVELLHNIKKIGKDIKIALEKDKPKRFGQWLKVHWDTKKLATNRMSNDKIDYWYQLALDNGAIGGKIMGAGGGGFFMFYVEPNHQRKVREIMLGEGLIEMPFKFDFDGTKILFNSR